MLNFLREFVRIEKDAKVLTTGEARKVICYRCERELGPDHNEEKCQRKGMSRRFFMSGIAATAGLAVAIDAGLFGEKSRELQRKLQPGPTPRLPGFVKKGEIVDFGSLAPDSVQIGMEMGGGKQLAFLGNYTLERGKMVAPHDMVILFTRVGRAQRTFLSNYDSMEWHRVESAPLPFRVLEGDAEVAIHLPKGSRFVTELTNALTKAGTVPVLR